jgi:hypothetical protein
LRYSIVGGPDVRFRRLTGAALTPLLPPPFETPATPDAGATPSGTPSSGANNGA